MRIPERDRSPLHWCGRLKLLLHNASGLSGNPVSRRDADVALLGLLACEGKTPRASRGLLRSSTCDRLPNSCSAGFFALAMTNATTRCSGRAVLIAWCVSAGTPAQRSTWRLCATGEIRTRQSAMLWCAIVLAYC